MHFANGKANSQMYNRSAEHKKRGNGIHPENILIRI